MEHTTTPIDASSRFQSLAEVQYSTFKVHGNCYGIPVEKVQEIVKPMQLTPVPHAPPFVRGLINLRGQIATAIGLLELFGLPVPSRPEMMNIICFAQGTLVSLLVDEVGDVLSFSSESIQEVPSTVDAAVARILDGVARTDNGLISLISLEKVATVIGIEHH